MVDVPQPTLSMKLAALWATNKPLVIGIIVGIVLLIAAIIFLIVFFVVIKPGHAASSPVVASTTTPTQPTAPADS